MLAQMIASVVAGNTANAIDNFDLSRPDYLVWVNPVPRERWAMFTAGKIDIIMINCLRGCLGMNEIIFWVKCDAEEGYIAQALGESIITQADNLDRLKLEVRDAVRCHFPDEELHPPMIRLVTEDGITL
nr:hypothetical protein [Spirulina subsalsa]